MCKNLPHKCFFLCPYLSHVHTVYKKHPHTSRVPSSRAPRLVSGLRAAVASQLFRATTPYPQKLIIVLFWYRCIACWGAIKFLIKTNCLSLTSTEFFPQLSDKNKYVLITIPLLLLPFSSLGVSHECKQRNLKICFRCYMTRKHLSWYLRSSIPTQRCLFD